MGILLRPDLVVVNDLRSQQAHEKDRAGSQGQSDQSTDDSPLRPAESRICRACGPYRLWLEGLGLDVDPECDLELSAS